MADIHRRANNQDMGSSNHRTSSLSNADFINKEASKHHWTKLQSKIKQRLMTENIS
jgi:hypothetical protein